MGLDVAVDDAAAVGVTKCLDDLGGEVERLAPVELIPFFLDILLYIVGYLLVLHLLDFVHCMHLTIQNISFHKVSKHYLHLL